MANPLALVNPWSVVQGYEYGLDRNNTDAMRRDAAVARQQKAQTDALKLDLAQRNIDEFSANAPVRDAQRQLQLNQFMTPMQQQAIDRQIASAQLATPGVSTVDALEQLTMNNVDATLAPLYQARLLNEYNKAAQQAALAGNLVLAEEYNRKAGRINLGFTQGTAPLNPAVLVDDNGVPNVVPSNTLLNAQGQPVTQRQYIEMQGGKVPAGIVAAETAASAAARAKMIQDAANARTAQNNQTRVYLAELAARAKGADVAKVDQLTQTMDSINRRIGENQTLWAKAAQNGLPTQFFEEQNVRLTQEANDLMVRARTEKERLDQQERLKQAADRGMAAAQGLALPTEEPTGRARGEVVTPEAPRPLGITPAIAERSTAPAAPLTVAPQSAVASEPQLEQAYLQAARELVALQDTAANQTSQFGSVDPSLQSQITVAMQKSNAAKSAYEAARQQRAAEEEKQRRLMLEQANQRGRAAPRSSVLGNYFVNRVNQ